MKLSTVYTTNLNRYDSWAFIKKCKMFYNIQWRKTKLSYYETLTKPSLRMYLNVFKDIIKHDQDSDRRIAFLERIERELRTNK